MAQKRISAGRLAELIDLTPANLSILKNNRAKAVRFFQLSMHFAENWNANPAIY